MTFSAQTLMALVTASALLITIVRHPLIGFVIFVNVLPIAMMLIAITCPKEGSLLNARGRWPLFMLGKAWLFTALGIAGAIVTFIFAPSIGERLVRVLSGDLHPYRLVLVIPKTSPLFEQLRREGKRIADDQGYVGDVLEVGRYYEQIDEGMLPTGDIYLIVSSQRREVPYVRADNYTITLRPGGVVYFSKHR